MSTLWEIRKGNIPNSGVGVFAKCDIKPGEIILEDNEFFDANGITAPRWILELKNSTDDHTTLGIVATNKIEIRDKTLVYRTFSRFNHSCNPNTENFTNGYNTVVVAIKNIKCGDELFVSYFKSLKFLNIEEAHKMILNIWKFSCKCDIEKSSWIPFAKEALRICNEVDEKKTDKVLAVIRNEHPIVAYLICIKVTRLCLKKGFPKLAEKYRDVYISIVDHFSKEFPNSELQKISRVLLDLNVPIDF